MEAVNWKPASNRFHDLLARRWAGLIVEDPSLLDNAASALDGMAGDHTEVWRLLLEAGVDAVVGVLTSNSEAVSALKSDAPFARMRLIPEDERQRLLLQAYL